MTDDAPPSDADPPSDPPVGRPIQVPRPPDAAPAPAPGKPEPATEPAAGLEQDGPGSGRAGDATVGRPMQTPMALTATTVTEAEVANTPSLRRAPGDRDLVIQPLTVPALLSGGATAMLLIGATATLALFTYAQGLSVLGSVAALPSLLQIPAYGVLGALILVILYAALRLALIIRRLRVNRQISMTRVRALSAQPGTAERAFDTVKDVLAAYLRYYDPAAARTESTLQDLGMDDESLKRLGNAREALLSSRPISSAAWVTEFEERFLTPLDHLAQNRVNAYAKLVAVKTAISPYGLLDTAAVLFNNFRLLGDLCRIYQLRANWTGTVYLLFLMVFHSYVAGEVGERLETLVEDHLEGALEGVPLIQATLGSKLAGKIGAKATEATGNFLFTRRIGSRALTSLRPLAT